MGAGVCLRGDARSCSGARVARERMRTCPAVHGGSAAAGWEDLAAHEDRVGLWDFGDWRTRSLRNPSRVGRARWSRGPAAPARLCEWAVQCEFVLVSPVPMRSVVGRTGDQVLVPTARARNARTGEVRRLTPRAFRRPRQGRSEWAPAPFCTRLRVSRSRSRGSGVSQPPRPRPRRRPGRCRKQSGRIRCSHGCPRPARPAVRPACRRPRRR